MNSTRTNKKTFFFIHSIKLPLCGLLSPFQARFTNIRLWPLNLEGEKEHTNCVYRINRSKPRILHKMRKIIRDFIWKPINFLVLLNQMSIKIDQKLAAECAINNGFKS